jgi:hypothetical protein
MRDASRRRLNEKRFEAQRNPSRPFVVTTRDFHDVKLGLSLSSVASPALYNATRSEPFFEEVLGHAAEGIQR